MSRFGELARAVQHEIGKQKPLSLLKKNLLSGIFVMFGDTRYVVEPNVKDGKGGLRDLHSLLGSQNMLIEPLALLIL